jgi:hypothetical protein
MIASEPTAPAGPTGGNADPVSVSAEASSDQPLTILRGNGVDIDPRRAGQWVLGVCVLALFVVAVVLLIAGIDKNSQINTLKNHGAMVNIKVIDCQGLLGGSGSNPAGYACKGSYAFQGRQYVQEIPGTSLLSTGSTVRGVIAPNDPRLLSTPSEVASQQASWTVYIAPVVLFLLLALALVVLILMLRRGPHASDPATPI